MRFVVHHPLPKRPKVYPEEHTRTIVLEEEVAKVIVALIMQEIGAWVMSSQRVYMGGGGHGPHFLTFSAVLFAISWVGDTGRKGVAESATLACVYGLLHFVAFVGCVAACQTPVHGRAHFYNR